MGFKRPLVQIQSLGPRKTVITRWWLFFVFEYLNRRPLANQIRRSASRTRSVGRPLVQIQSLEPWETVITSELHPIC